MTPEDQYKGMPIYLQRAAQKNLRAADRSIENVNRAGRNAVTQIPGSIPNPVPANGSPVATPFQFALGGTPDTSIGAPLPDSTTAITAASRATPDVVPRENSSGYMVNPQTTGLNAAYNKTVFQPSPSYQAWEAKRKANREQRQQQQQDPEWQDKQKQQRQQYGWSAFNEPN